MRECYGCRYKLGLAKKSQALDVKGASLIDGLALLDWSIQSQTGLIQYMYMFYHGDRFRFVYIEMHKRVIRTSFQQTMKFMVLLFANCLCLDARAAFRVVLDPGHGGHDNGAVFDGIREADLVLAVGSKLSRYLKEHTGWNVVTTREGDRFVSLHDRVRKAQENESDLFVSIHANSAGKNQKVHGAEFFFHEVDRATLVPVASGNNGPAGELGGNSNMRYPSSEAQNIVESLRQQGLARQSMLVTKLIWSVWRESAESPLARLKQEPFFVLAKNAIPSVLIEVGFMSHPQEIKKLMNSDYQDRIVKKIASALIRYKESLDKSQAK